VRVGGVERKFERKAGVFWRFDLFCSFHLIIETVHDVPMTLFAASNK